MNLARLFVLRFAILLFEYYGTEAHVSTEIEAYEFENLSNICLQFVSAHCCVWLMCLVISFDKQNDILFLFAPLASLLA
jgi:hypothetical protein